MLEILNLVYNTMNEAESAYSHGNESEYERLESVARNTLQYAVNHGNITRKQANDIAEACCVIM